MTRLFLIFPARRILEPGSRGGLRDMVAVRALDMSDAMVEFYRQYPEAGEIDRIDDRGVPSWSA